MSAPRTSLEGRRLTLSEIVQMLLSKSGGDHSVIELSRNARGVTQITVTVRTGDTAEITTAIEAEAAAVDIYERLRAKYPMPSGFVGAEHEPTPAPDPAAGPKAGAGGASS